MKQQILIFVFYIINIILSTPFIPLYPNTDDTKPPQITFSCLKGNYQINVELNKKLISSLISLTSPISYFLPSDYNPDIENRIDGPSIITIKKALYLAEKYSSNLVLRGINHIFTKYAFYSLSQTNQELPKHNSLSFALNQKNMTNSIPHILYNAGIIDKPAFNLHRFVFIDGKMSFGSPRMVRKIEPGICEVNTELIGWNCPMRAIINKNNSDIITRDYLYESFALFEVNQNKTTTPCQFIYYIKENVIKNYFDNGSCFLVEYDDKIRIECDKFEKILKFPHLQIDFYNFGMNVPLRFLFVCYKDKNCYSLFKCRKNFNNFIFGSSFTQLITLHFDYSSNTISFISEGLSSNIIEIYENSKNKTINNQNKYNNIENSIHLKLHLKNLFNIMLLSLILMSIYLSFVKIKEIK